MSWFIGTSSDKPSGVHCLKKKGYITPSVATGCKIPKFHRDLNSWEKFLKGALPVGTKCLEGAAFSLGSAEGSAG